MNTCESLSGDGVRCTLDAGHPEIHMASLGAGRVSYWHGSPLNYEKASPVYIGPLPHYARRMLQALDGYWLHCDGLPKGRYPRSRATAEDWWGRFEKYRTLVEGQL